MDACKRRDYTENHSDDARQYEHAISSKEMEDRAWRINSTCSDSSPNGRSSGQTPDHGPQVDSSEWIARSPEPHTTTNQTKHNRAQQREPPPQPSLTPPEPAHDRNRDDAEHDARKKELEYTKRKRGDIHIQR